MESDTPTSARPRLDRSQVEAAAMSMARAQLLSLAFVVPLLLLSVVPHWMLWGPPSGNPFPQSLLGAFVASIVVHEALHGLGYYWGGAGWSEIEFGFNWSGLAPYAHCSTALRATPYRTAIALPGLVLGPGPLIAGLGLGSWWLTLYALLMLLAAAGDTLLLWIMRDVPGDTWVQDHPSEMGCLVLGHASSPEPPLLTTDLDADDADTDDGLSVTTLVAMIVLATVLGAAAGFFFGG